MRLVIETETPRAARIDEAIAQGAEVRCDGGCTFVIAARRARRQARRQFDGWGERLCGLRASGKHWVETFTHLPARDCGGIPEAYKGAKNHMAH